MTGKQGMHIVPSHTGAQLDMSDPLDRKIAYWEREIKINWQHT
jgi:hypothetical protein